jgi:hypothetical protein
MKNKIGRDLKNRLTDYSLACGYIERQEKNGIQIELWKEPSCKVYSIRKHDFNNGKRLFWLSFETRHEAYNFFNKNKI